MIKIIKFRTNDLNPSRGKQIEFNTAVAKEIFDLDGGIDTLTVVFHYIGKNNLFSRDIKSTLKLSPQRGDYKIYQNEDGSTDLKSFFINELHLTESNIDDYFAIQKTNQLNYYNLYYIKRDEIFSAFYDRVELKKEYLNETDIIISEKKSNYSKEELISILLDYLNRANGVNTPTPFISFGFEFGNCFIDGTISAGNFISQANISTPNAAYYLGIGIDLYKATFREIYGIRFGEKRSYCINNIIKFPLQRIFYGAPGTGKSFEINKLTKGHDVIRTTFHPDSDYSTFVGAYKPSMGDYRSIYGLNGSTTVALVNPDNGEPLREAKIEYKFVKQAFLKAYIAAWKKLSMYEPMDKTFTVGSDEYEIIGIGDDCIKVKKGSADDEYETKKDKLKGIYEGFNSNDKSGQNPNDISDPNIVTDIDRGVGKKLKSIDPNSFDGAWENLINSFVKPQFLIIEEINRGNCAQIFGDLFQLLDRQDNGFSEYPIEADSDIQKEIEKAFREEVDYKLTYDINVEGNVKNYKSNHKGGTLSKDIKEGRILLLPPNLFIWATMNTSDQSLFPIDSAFKRRWDWTYIPIKKSEKDNYKIEVKGIPYDWWSFIDQMNKVVEKATESEDKKMGYYFCKPDKGDGVISAKKFVNKVLFYLYNDVFKDNGLDWDLDGQPVFKYTEDKDKEVIMTFAKYFDLDGNPNEEQVEHLMKNLNVEENSAFDAEYNGEGTGFKLDGKDMSLRDIAKTVVLNYANNNPSLSAQNVRDYFIDLCKGIGVAHIVETETEYHKRDGQPSQKRTVSEITIPSGEKLYVSTQWRAKNKGDNFMKFLEMVNSNSLGTISK